MNPIDREVLKDVQDEYNHIFKTDPIHDEVVGYRWLANTIKGSCGMGYAHCRLLDVACGGGYFLREVRNIFGGNAQLAGSDLSSEALRLARQSTPTAQFSLSPAEELPYQDNAFDVVTCLGSMEHFLNIPQSIKEMKRVSTKEALFFVLLPNAFWYKDIASVWFLGKKKTRNQTHERFACHEEWKTTLESNGLRVFKTLKYNGIAKHNWKQRLKDILTPLQLSYHFLFICRKDK